MAVETPVLERRTTQLIRANNIPFAVPTRSEYEAEDEHNARIKDTYARLINPDCSIDEVFHPSASVEQAPVQEVQPMQTEPYLVQNARVDSAIFRADNPINKRFVADATVVDVACEDEENDDLRPTAATRQYRTVESVEENEETTGNESFSMTKKQKTAIIVVAAVIVALIALIIINATVIANLNNDIATITGDIAGINAELQESIANISDKINKAQSGLDTLRGATAGANVSGVLYGIVA